MRETYRKFGSVVRRENDYVVRVDEAGEAIEENGKFSCYPIAAEGGGTPLSVQDVNAFADEIQKLVRPPLGLERLIVSDGQAFHEFGNEKWSERSRRLHVAITRGANRVLIDLAEFDIEPIRRACTALARLNGERKVDAVHLTDNVGAALLPSLTGDLRMEQWAAPHDGKGEWIANLPVTATDPPNWFRPSYRARPVRAWFHLRVSKFGSITGELPQGVALLAPVDGRTLRVLCTEGRSAFAVTMPVNAVVAASPSQGWYPYGAGTFGAELVCI